MKPLKSNKKIGKSYFLKNQYMLFSQLLIDWYRQHKRELPWRETSDPYKIWISEIILQQTRVNQGLSYYYNFINRFPDIISLSEANEDEVLKLWQGLGYYSRARNLHATAKIIASDYNGHFPDDYPSVIKLKGIGEYTAAAICSFAFNLPYAVVDGNVFRILSRVFEIRTPIDGSTGKKEFTSLASELLDKKNPSLFNQAIMDLGALVCTPLSPRCPDCPLQHNCLAYINKTWDALPVKKTKIEKRNRFFYYFYVITPDGKTFLSQRKDKDIWRNLYELPLLETDKLYQDITLAKKIRNFLEANFINIHIHKSYSPIKHILSHQRIFASFFEVTAEKKTTSDVYIALNESEIGNYPVSRLTEIFLDEIKDS
jgi:A/G-specific adenine glycosylase